MTTQTTLHGWNEYVSAKQVFSNLKDKILLGGYQGDDLDTHFFYFTIITNYEIEHGK